MGVLFFTVFLNYYHILKSYYKFLEHHVDGYKRHSCNFSDGRFFKFYCDYHYSMIRRGGSFKIQRQNIQSTCLQVLQTRYTFTPYAFSGSFKNTKWSSLMLLWPVIFVKILYNTPQYLMFKSYTITRPEYVKVFFFFCTISF